MIEYPDDLGQMICPIEKTASLISSKWSLMIIRDLYLTSEPLRYSEILRSLSPISSKTLAQKLKELENYRIVDKEIRSSSPPSVYYSLSEKGQDLGPVMEAMAQWSLKWHSG